LHRISACRFAIKLSAMDLQMKPDPAQQTAAGRNSRPAAAVRGESIPVSPLFAHAVQPLPDRFAMLFPSPIGIALFIEPLQVRLRGIEGPSTKA
jgi:hypothetical protein